MVTGSHPFGLEFFFWNDGAQRLQQHEQVMMQRARIVAQAAKRWAGNGKHYTGANVQGPCCQGTVRLRLS